MSSLNPSGEIQAYPFPCKINFPGFHCLFNLSWYHMGRGREESFSSSKCLLLSRYLLAVSLENLKQIKLYNNSYRLKEYLALESSKVCWIRKIKVFLCFPPYLIFYL